MAKWQQAVLEWQHPAWDGVRLGSGGEVGGAQTVGGRPARFCGLRITVGSTLLFFWH